MDRAISDRGTGNSLKLKSRCYSREILFTERYEDFEQQVKAWISTCVRSRTMNSRTGEPFRREVRLVEDNQSLKSIWLEARNLRSQGLFTPWSIRIYAHYEPVQIGKGDWGVKSITFSTSKQALVDLDRRFDQSFDFLPENVVTKSINGIAKDFKLLMNKYWLRKSQSERISNGPKFDRVMCALEGIRKFGTQIDDRVIQFNVLFSRQNTIGGYQVLKGKFPAKEEDLEMFQQSYIDLLLGIHRSVVERQDRIENEINEINHKQYPTDSDISRLEKLNLDPGIDIPVGNQLLNLDRSIFDAVVRTREERVKWESLSDKSGWIFIERWMEKQMQNTGSVYHCYKKSIDIGE